MTNATATVDLDPALFRAPHGQAAYLVGGKCRSCGAVTWGVRSMCPSCWAEGAQEEVPIGRRGKLYSATTVRHAAQGFTPPYMMGVIDLDEGLRVIARVLADPNAGWRKDSIVALEAGPLSRGQDGSEVVGPVFRVTQEAP